MGLICNDLENKLSDEENYNVEDNEEKSKKAGFPTRRRKLFKQSLHKPRNFLHTLFKWYFKSRELQRQNVQRTASDYEISIENISTLSCNDDETSLVYRQQKNPHQTSGASSAKAPQKYSSSSNLTHGHHIVRQSICLYAASSVILALCYLATPSSATTEAPSHSVWVIK